MSILLEGSSLLNQGIDLAVVVESCYFHICHQHRAWLAVHQALHAPLLNIHIHISIFSLRKPHAAVFFHVFLMLQHFVIPGTGGHV